jgi:hypothetical protein
VGSKRPFEPVPAGCRLYKTSSTNVFHFHFYRLSFAFAALRKPRRESFGIPCGLHSKTGLDFSLRDGKDIIKFSGISEIAHAETIQPIERARFSFARDFDFNGEFLCVHGASITSPRMSPVAAIAAQNPGGGVKICSSMLSNRNTNSAPRLASW